MTDRRKYRHEDDDVSRMAGDSGRVVAERRQGRGRSVKVASTQTEETAATKAAHAGSEASQAAGASGVAKADSGTNEKRTTMMVVRINVFFFASTRCVR